MCGLLLLLLLLLLSVLLLVVVVVLVVFFFRTVSSFVYTVFNIKINEQNSRVITCR